MDLVFPNYESLERISKACGSESFYYLDIDKYEKNLSDFLNAFKSTYKNTRLGYSYKTNYVPAICKKADEFGCFAEVVSRMEYEIALSLGIDPKNIILNGPYKQYSDIEYAVLNGSKVNLDSHYEVESLLKIASKNEDHNIDVGLRCFFNIRTGTLSRFGFDAEASKIHEVFRRLEAKSNVNVVGLHCHFSTGSRDLESFRIRTRKLLELSKQLRFERLDYIDIGGGFFGHLPEKLKKLFDVEIPTYEEYGQVVAHEVKEFYPDEAVMLILEPGAAVVADTMTFFAKIIDIKRLDQRDIALCAGSIHNVKPTGNTKNLPIEVILSNEDLAPEYFNLSISGYTCMEHDYLYRDYNGKLDVGSFIKFSNMGAYTVVFTPPFIKGAPPIVGYQRNDKELKIYRRQQNASDLLKSFNF